MKTIFVPRFFDEDNCNAQNLNAKALLCHFKSNNVGFVGVYYNPPIKTANNIKLIKLWRRSLFKLHMVILYQGKYDAIFYPGKDPFDKIGLLLRIITGRRIPVIATLEGIPGNDQREEELTKLIGHKVGCHHINNNTMNNFDYVHYNADHIIAISPFLAKVGKHLYGDKFSVLPLGIDNNIFYPENIKKNNRFTVIAVASFQDRKRPELYLDLAIRYPQADFIWYGEGERRAQFIKECKKRKINNLSFPGKIQNQTLAKILRKSDLFLLPSKSEGVPKVTQEAAACGLPVIIFGYYEAPTVIDGENGYVVWNDEDLFAKVGELINDRNKAKRMGSRGAELAREWGWDSVALRWQGKIKDCII